VRLVAPIFAGLRPAVLLLEVILLQEAAPLSFSSSVAFCLPLLVAFLRCGPPFDVFRSVELPHSFFESLLEHFTKATLHHS
jgi:hypothetical protein